MTRQEFDPYLLQLRNMGMDDYTLGMYRKQIAKMLQAELHPHPLVVIDLESFFAETENTDNETE